MAEASPAPAVLDVVRTLVAFDTTSRNSNRALIDYARGIDRKSTRLNSSHT